MKWYSIACVWPLSGSGLLSSPQDSLSCGHQVHQFTIFSPMWTLVFTISQHYGCAVVLWHCEGKMLQRVWQAAFWVNMICSLQVIFIHIWINFGTDIVIDIVLFLGYCDRLCDKRWWSAVSPSSRLNLSNSLSCLLFAAQRSNILTCSRHLDLALIALDMFILIWINHDTFHAQVIIQNLFIEYACR